jgi:hypothetical protein
VLQRCATRVAQILGTVPTARLGKGKGPFILDGSDFNVNKPSYRRDLAVGIAQLKLNAIAQKNLAGAVTTGPVGSFEYRSPATISSGDPAVTYFYTPGRSGKPTVWFANFTNWMSVHQVVPGRFLGHALKSSG